MDDMDCRTKIIATLGPACEDVSILETMIQAGMNVGRLNFSHGTHESHGAMIIKLRKLALSAGTSIAILQDLQGPKLRIGNLPEPLKLVNGQTVRLYSGAMDEATAADMTCIPIDIESDLSIIPAESTILVADGQIHLFVDRAAEDYVLASVVSGGILTSHKGIHLPGIQLDVLGLTDKDRKDIAFGIAQGVDSIAISYVRGPEDVALVRSEIAIHSPKFTPLLIAKLEKPEALRLLDEILDVADGVMVARGDLGIEIPPEDVPSAQKRIIQAANQRGKLVITATQMLESMIHNVLPTRAEASDVANAVYDGSDGLMLSGETAIGLNPVASVAMMDRIIRRAEEHFGQWGNPQDIEVRSAEDAYALARAARELAHDRDVAAIAVFTQSGRTALVLSKTRPQVSILAFTPNLATYQRMAMYWGVRPYEVPFAETIEEMIAYVEGAIRESGTVKPGQQVVLVTGFPLRESRLPNMALLHTIQG